MRLGSHLLAGLALGALSLGPAVARHHSHAYHGTSLHHIDTGPQSHDDPKTVTPAHNVSDVKDEPKQKDVDKTTNDKTTNNQATNNDDRHGPHKFDKPETSKDHTTGEREAPPSIDTRITVHQGREPIKGLHWHQLGQSRDGTSKLADAPGAKRARDKYRYHREANEKRSRDERRNALGAKIDTDKEIGEHRNATGLLVTSPVNSKPDPKASAVRPPSGATGQETRTTLQDKVQPSRPNTPPLPAVTSAKGVGIGGTDLVRPAVRTGMIAGTPKIAGVISGNNVSVRHP
jgi:hypothetical protein